MDDFVKVFTAGLLLFFLAFLLSGQTQLYPDRSIDDGDGIVTPDVNGDTIFYKSSIATEKAKAVRHIDFGDLSVGYIPTDTILQEKEEVIIKKGIFFRSQELVLDFSGVDVTKAYLTFELDNTNNYGDLIITLNDRLINSTIVNTGVYVVVMDKLNETNSLKISTENSGLRFWAPTMYILKDVKLLVKEYSNEKRLESFDIKDFEMEGLSGRLVFTVENALLGDTLNVKLNEKEI